MIEKVEIEFVNGLKLTLMELIDGKMVKYPENLPPVRKTETIEKKKFKPTSKSRR